MRNLILLLILTFLSNKGIGQNENSIEIWIRAFIPDSKNAGAASAYVKGTSNKKSAILLQPYSKSYNYCFDTDNRGFSTDENQSSRMETRFKLNLLNEKGIVHPLKNPSSIQITKNIDCITGKVLEKGQGSINADNLGNPIVAGEKVQIAGHAQSTNTLFPLIGGFLTPSIDYSYDFQWSPSSSKLLANITIGSFPAIEVYARRPNGKWHTVLQQFPTGVPLQLAFDSYGINSTLVKKEILIEKIKKKTHYIKTNTGSVSYGDSSYGCMWTMKYENVDFSFELDAIKQTISKIKLSNNINETGNGRNCTLGGKQKHNYKVTSSNFNHNNIRIKFSPHASNYIKCNAEFNGSFINGEVIGTLKWESYDLNNINYTLSKKIIMNSKDIPKPKPKPKKRVFTKEEIRYMNSGG